MKVQLIASDVNNLMGQALQCLHCYCFTALYFVHVNFMQVYSYSYNGINNTFYYTVMVGTSSTEYTNSLDVVAIAVPVGISMAYR